MQAASDQQVSALIERYGQPLKEEVIACETDQSNFPHPKNQPWAKDGRCSICDAEVAMIRVSPDSPNTYSHIAPSHSRVRRWFAVDADELQALLDYQENW